MAAAMGFMMCMDCGVDGLRMAPPPGTPPRQQAKKFLVIQGKSQSQSTDRPTKTESRPTVKSARNQRRQSTSRSPRGFQNKAKPSLQAGTEMDGQVDSNSVGSPHGKSKYEISKAGEDLLKKAWEKMTQWTDTRLNRSKGGNFVSAGRLHTFLTSEEAAKHNFHETSNDVDEVVASMDPNETGKITWESFLEVMKLRHSWKVVGGREGRGRPRFFLERGKISELKNFLKAEGDVDGKVFSAMDRASGNLPAAAAGQISWKAFVEVMRHWKTWIAIGGSVGFVSAERFRDEFLITGEDALDEREANSVMKNLDPNSTGKISWEHFVEYMTENN